MKPFDIILFKGRDISSNLVAITEKISTGNSSYSHIGILVNSDILPQISEMQKDKWYVLESTANLVKSDGPKNIFGKRKFGVQIRDLDSLISEYNGDIYYAELKDNPIDHLSLQYLQNKMSVIYTNYINKLYEMNCVDLCSAAFKCCRPIRKALNIVQLGIGKVLIRNWNPDKNDPNDMIYCSQLAAVILQDIGVLSTTVDTRNYLPVDVLGIREGYPEIVISIRKLSEHTQVINDLSTIISEIKESITELKDEVKEQIVKTDVIEPLDGIKSQAIELVESVSNVIVPIVIESPPEPKITYVR